MNEDPMFRVEARKPERASEDMATFFGYISNSLTKYTGGNPPNVGSHITGKPLIGTMYFNLPSGDKFADASWEQLKHDAKANFAIYVQDNDITDLEISFLDSNPDYSNQQTIIIKKVTE